MELLALLLVLWCVYVSDAVWWTTSDRLLFTGRRVGSFRVRRGPSLDVRNGQGFFAARLVPPFHYAFECDWTAAPGPRTKAPKAAAIERLAARTIEHAAPVRTLGQGLWIYLFAIVPVIVASLGLARTWLPLLATLLVWLIVIVVAYRRSWRLLHQDDASGWRSDAALLILSPPGAMRAADRLTRRAFAGVSALRAMSVLAPPEEFCRVARLLYFEEASASQFAVTQEIDEIVQSMGLAARFAAAPDRVPGMLGYCRRCHEQVLRCHGNCPDCVGISITPYQTERG